MSTIIGDIEKWKGEREAVILAHNYQLSEVQDVADFTGDSLELAVAAQREKAPTIVLCGVDFMAETAKLLNPGSRVLLPVKDASCPLAAHLTPPMIRQARTHHQNAQCVLYINSTAACKAEADCTCTSANAEKVVRALPATEILFGPDANLACYVAGKVPEKSIIPLPPGGHCYVHETFSPDDVYQARREGRAVICHPECRPSVQALADTIASTSGMIREAGKARAWAVLTEREMGYRLRKIFPDRDFSLKNEAVCKDMKKTRLPDILSSLVEMRYEVVLDPVIMERASAAVRMMIRTGGP